MRRLLAALLVASLSACGQAKSEESGDAGTTSTQASPFATDAELPDFDEDQAREDASAEVASEGYQGSCTDDCSGHNAGFNYAAEGHDDGGVSDSPSFDEGQQAYDEAVDEKVEEKRQAHDDGEDE